MTYKIRAATLRMGDVVLAAGRPRGVLRVTHNRSGSIVSADLVGGVQIHCPPQMLVTVDRETTVEDHDAPQVVHRSER